MARALFGSLAVDRRQIGNWYTRQAMQAGVTVSPQDVRRELQWRQELLNPEGIARHKMAEEARIEREFTAIAGELGAQAIDTAVEAEMKRLAQSAGEAAVGQTVEYPLEKRTVLV